MSASGATPVADKRSQGAQPANTNALKSGTHAHALIRARELVALDEEGIMPEVPVSRAGWARLFGTDVKAVEMAERRLAKSLARQEGLPVVGLPALSPLARQRLALLNLLKRATMAGIAYGYALYEQASPGFFAHVRLLARDERRIRDLEQRVIQDLADAAAPEAKR